MQPTPSKTTTSKITPAARPPALTKVTQDNPWRVPVPVLHQGKYQSVIIDRGQLTKAVPGSTNYYLFSKTGAGVKSLAIIGTPLQIMDFLLTKQKQGIENQITSLPDIYIGFSRYTPKERFSGVFGLGDTFTTVVGFFAGLAPVPDWVNIASIPATLKSMKASIDKLSDAQKAKGDVLYVKFSYLPENGMQKIGTKKVGFEEVLQIFQKHHKKIG